MEITATAFNDVSDQFEFLEDGLEYYDAPIAGYLKHKVSDALFAFDCAVVVVGRVVHWSLVPVDEVGEDATDKVREALVGQATPWLSILEDRRTEHARCLLVPMSADASPTVLSSGALVRPKGG